MNVKISVVIPANNEGTNVENLYKKISEVLRRNYKEYEIIIVDDGSTDDTFDILKKLHKSGKKLKAVRLSRRFGQSPALTAGFEVATGDIIVTLDADLQNDPGDIPKIVGKIEEGYDVVSGWRHDRKDPFLTKIIPSRIFNFLTRRMTGIPLHDFGCTLKGFRKEALEGVKLYGQTHRLTPALAKLNGFTRITEIEVRHHKRSSGKARYGILFGKYNLFSRFRQYMRDVRNIRKSMGKEKPVEYFSSLYGNKKLYEVKEQLLD